ncbi:hypothetical protein CYLTODRAFT_455695 [Cylindrobasidium torrendii FP15055 ss-10]|uniref:Uncharacterized protein n=1 Tax=Cylindrobasidium torrendii FP15055 ss-10 TaxID=1314674 RepID=A0A0D7B6J4_9AGAR|nr:hypothetical protein CYLTODRAFT_455695 [Cylindrobasidium torrendii FP15055 ss-10]
MDSSDCGGSGIPQMEAQTSSFTEIDLENNELDATTVRGVKAYLRDLRGDAAVVHARAEALRQALHEAEALHESITTNIAKHTALLRPIHALPLEILSRILFLTECLMVRSISGTCSPHRGGYGSLPPYAGVGEMLSKSRRGYGDP